MYIFHIVVEYPDEYEMLSQVLCVNFGVSHSTMYKTEIEAKMICNSNRNCLGILQWDHSTTGKVFSHCLFPNKLILKNQDTHESDDGITMHGKYIAKENFRGILLKKIQFGKLHGILFILIIKWEFND